MGAQGPESLVLIEGESHTFYLFNQGRERHKVKDKNKFINFICKGLRNQHNVLIKKSSLVWFIIIYKKIRKMSQSRTNLNPFL